MGRQVGLEMLLVLTLNAQAITFILHQRHHCQSSRLDAPSPSFRLSHYHNFITAEDLGIRLLKTTCWPQASELTTTMASFLSYIPVVNRLLGSGGPERVFDIAPPELHNIEANPDRRARCLKHLLKANHVNYSLMYNNLQFHNHNPHVLCSAYLLGASVEQLQTIYDKEIESLEPWTPSPCEVTEDDWPEYLGDARFQRAFVDFFEDQLVMGFAYDWKKLLEHYMFLDKNRLLYGLFGGCKRARAPVQDSTDVASSGTPPHPLGVCV